MARKKSGGARKHGRNSDKCKRYKLAKTKERNKTAKIRKHLIVHTDDKQAREALRAWEGRL